MKKYILFTIVTLNACLAATSQSNSFEYSVHGGANINSASGTSIVEDYESILAGPCIGGQVKLNMSKNFGLKAALEYSQKGWSYKGFVFEDNLLGTTFGKSDIFFKLNYLNLPVLAEYTFGQTIQFKIDAGLFFGVLINNKIVRKKFTSMTSNSPGSVVNTSSSWKSTNFGLSFGPGVQIPLTKKMKLDLDCRDDFGLVNIDKSGSTLKTRTLSLLLGFTFSM